MKKVEVTLPVVRLRVEDLAYLQGLQNNEVKCIIPHGKKDRLELLGLAEYKTLPPCPKEMKVWQGRQADKIREMKKELGKEDPDLSRIRDLASSYGKPQERRVFVITKAGAALLTKGSAMVRVKGECK